MALRLPVHVLAVLVVAGSPAYAGRAGLEYIGATKTGARKVEALPKEARERLWQLALEAPTVDHATLAKRYAADPVLRGLRQWSAEEVGYLRYTSRLVPSDRVRHDAFAVVAAQHLERASPQAGLEAAVARLTEKHPGASIALLNQLGAKSPQLAKALRRFAAGETRATSRDPASAAKRLVAANPTLVDRLPLTMAQVTRTLARPTSPLRRRLLAGIEAIERETGDGDGSLRPLDVTPQAQPTLRAILDDVWQRLGKRELTMAEIDGQLADSVGRVLSNGGSLATALRRDAVAETLADLAEAYDREVIAGTSSLTELGNRRKLAAADWAQIRALTPSLFADPASVPLAGRRLDAVAALYGAMCAGEITAVAFYARSKISREALLLLQGSDPRFARPEGTRSWQTVAGSKHAEPEEVRIEALAAAWRSEVTSRQLGMLEFGRRHAIPKRELQRIVENNSEQFPRPDANDDERLAAQLVAGTAALRRQDPLMRMDEIIDDLAKDPAVRAWLPPGKPLTRSRYQVLRSTSPQRFPDLNDPTEALALLADDVRALLAEDASLGPTELAAALRLRYPRFRLSRIYQLRAAYPDLIVPAAPQRATTDQRRLDAEKIAGLFTGSRTLSDIGRELKREHPRFTIGYVAGLRRSFSDDVFVERPLATHRYDRPHKMVDELLSLTAQLLPPGATQQQLISATNVLLEKRGVAPLPGRQLPEGERARFVAQNGTLDELQAPRVSELVVEYAQAAPKSSTEAEILAAIERDYPHLTRERIASYHALFARDPKRYPAFVPYRVGGALVLRGGGAPPANPRFLGGWDPARALLAHDDAALHERLASMTDYARISPSLPLLDQLVDQLAGDKPLAHQHVLMVSHLLGSTVALTNALAAAGATRKGMVVVGTPYGSNHAVAETLRGQGIDVRVPALDESAYREAVRQAVDEAVSKQRATHLPFVVLDDGGLVAEILHGDPKYADVLSQFKIVEQTTRGITTAQKLRLKTSIVSVARSRAKAAEAEIIGHTVAAKVVQALSRAGRDLTDKVVVVKGYGTIGKPLCRLLEERGARVLVMEKGAKARRGAAKRYEVVDESALETADIVIGATGLTSIGLDDLVRLKDGAIVASASSKQVEIDMAGLRKNARQRTVLAQKGTRARLPAVSYDLGGRKLLLLGDGWPINFDGDVDSAPPEDIQITRAAMFAGALQAGRLRGHRKSAQRIIPLDEKSDDFILDSFRALRRKRGPGAVADPDRWADALRAIAKELSL